MKAGALLLNLCDLNRFPQSGSDLPARGGIVTASALISSYATRTSPVLCGKWIRKSVNAPPRRHRQMSQSE
jgi:hypothetical protein